MDEAEMAETGPDRSCSDEDVESDGDLAVLDRVEAELADVERALRRLDDGTYGTCEACGSPIDDSYMELHPAARLCPADQGEAGPGGATGT